MQDRSLPAIVSLTVAQRAYLRAQGIAVIAVTADGVVKIARDIARIHKPVAAWWCEPAGAVPLLKHCRESGSNDVPAAARELCIILTPHDRVAARAAVYVARIDDALLRAKRCGLLGEFNGAYRRARRAARAEGRGFMSYATAHKRLTRLIFDVAGRRPLTRSLIAEALGIDGGERRAASK